MTKKYLLKSVVIFALAITLLLLIQQVVNAEVKVTVTQEKRKPAIVNITSDVEFAEVRIYRKISTGKFILIYKAEPENAKTFECKIPISHLSTTEKREFKVIIKDKEGNIIGQDSPTIEPIPSAVPIDPSETAAPSWSPSPIPTKPTPTTSVSTAPTESAEPSETTEPGASTSTSPEVSPSAEPSPSTSEPSDPNKVYKVLIIGNSYTYYNDLGGILTELGKKTGNKMVVVEATHGGKEANWFAEKELSAYYWDGRGDKTKVVLNNGTTLKYNTNLKAILDKDWADLGRAGNWDYIFMSNQGWGKTNAEIKNGDKKVYELVKNKVTDIKNFGLFCTYVRDGDGKDRLKLHVEVAREKGFSIIDLAEIYEDYGSNWRKEFTILDTAKHPTATAQYFVATALYAKIFGKDKLAKTSTDSNFIKLYNADGKYLKDKIAYTNKSDTGKGQTKTCNSVTASKAKKIQAIIYKRYEKYILYDVGNTTPSKINLDQTKSTLELHTNMTLKATITPATATGPITWSTTNSKVAKVTGNGRIHATGKGTAVITAKTQNGKEAKCTVKVEEKGISKKKVSDIKPYKTIKVNVKSEGAYKTAQGMARIKVDGKWYLFCLVIKTSSHSDRNTANTLVFIVEESSGKVVARIKDYSFGHGNAATADENYIYVSRTGYTSITRVDKKYISEAIKKYNNNGKKIITKDFTKNYVKVINVGCSVKSLGYDTTHKQLYACDNKNICLIKINGNNATYKQVVKLPHIKEELDGSGYVGCNTGICFCGDYMLIPRYFSSKKVDGVTKNAINVYKCSFTDGVISEINYKTTIVFNKSPLKDTEIECIQTVDTAGKVVVFYNSSGTNNTDDLYYIDVKNAFN